MTIETSYVLHFCLIDTRPVPVCGHSGLQEAAGTDRVVQHRLDRTLLGPAERRWGEQRASGHEGQYRGTA